MSKQNGSEKSGVTETDHKAGQAKGPTVTEEDQDGNLGGEPSQEMPETPQDPPDEESVEGKQVERPTNEMAEADKVPPEVPEDAPHARDRAIANQNEEIGKTGETDNEQAETQANVVEASNVDSSDPDVSPADNRAMREEIREEARVNATPDNSPISTTEHSFDDNPEKGSPEALGGEDSKVSPDEDFGVGAESRPTGRHIEPDPANFIKTAPNVVATDQRDTRDGKRPHTDLGDLKARARRCGIEFDDEKVTIESLQEALEEYTERHNPPRPGPRASAHREVHVPEGVERAGVDEDEDDLADVSDKEENQA